MAWKMTAINRVRMVTKRIFDHIEIILSVRPAHYKILSPTIVFLHCMEREGVLPCSGGAASSPYPELK